ncbi:MAG: branched-chain amino acid aminotransferase [Alloprevotella sp.]|nr:branched-chain amino acid aminotransferase [Alloprevotella sp.]
MKVLLLGFCSLQSLGYLRTAKYNENMEVNLDWKNLRFGYVPTDYNVRCYYRNGEWGEIEQTSDVTIPLHMAASCLHYGQECFEGLKAFRCPDGKVRVFRMEANAHRMQASCRGIVMPELPTEKFCEMVRRVVNLNLRFVPPYESGAALYVRPLIIGISPRVGVQPSEEYLAVMFVSPVGPYFKGGFATNNYVIMRGYDRAAPLGTGRYKVGGNYAASLYANREAHEAGYAGEFYLDPREKKYIDECGACNFFGIKNDTYITPASSSILPSITNESLQQVARDIGMKVECRPVPEDELATFEEAGGCGTAAVISPINRIDDPEAGKSYQIAKDNEPGPWCKRLYKAFRDIQYGIAPDKYGWVTVLD